MRVSYLLYHADLTVLAEIIGSSFFFLGFLLASPFAFLSALIGSASKVSEGSGLDNSLVQSPPRVPATSTAFSEVEERSKNGSERDSIVLASLGTLASEDESYQEVGLRKRRIPAYKREENP